VISFVIGKMQVHHLSRGAKNERRAFTVAWANSAKDIGPHSPDDP
jgi:hypothetical protein